ncbi:MAG: helix-turn-helix domain-containing protein, partial [Rubritalea sp.]|uniref:helix-turn-helix domain-containing protein n=1 Tax=Rubritalea sp. TaxID=2109375 RepID=UPI00324231F1
MTYKHLSREERYTISILRRKGESNASIASTIGRNLSPSGGYNYNVAQKLSDRRSNSASCRGSRICEDSWEFAKSKITE